MQPILKPYFKIKRGHWKTCRAKNAPYLGRTSPYPPFHWVPPPGVTSELLLLVTVTITNVHLFFVKSIWPTTKVLYLRMFLGPALLYNSYCVSLVYFVYRWCNVYQVFAYVALPPSIFCYFWWKNKFELELLNPIILKFKRNAPNCQLNRNYVEKLTSFSNKDKTQYGRREDSQHVPWFNGAIYITTINPIHLPFFCALVPL